MTVDLTGQPGPAAATTSPLDELLFQSPQRRWPIFIGALIGMLVIAGWWLSQYFAPFTGAQPPSTVPAGDIVTTGRPVSDELTQFITHSMENNLITSSANPLLTPRERTEMVIEALAGLNDPTERQEAIEQHQRVVEEMKQQPFGKEAWYDHIAACRKVCHVAFSALTERHFTKVSQHVHQAIMFATGSDQLSSSSRRDILHFADLLMSPIYKDQHILLIGRASRLGAHGYNMALSERRVHRVKNQLRRSGVPAARIKEFWLGWEQPYLTRSIAELYRIPGFLFDDDEIKLNQSVIMVLY